MSVRTHQILKILSISLLIGTFFVFKSLFAQTSMQGFVPQQGTGSSFESDIAQAVRASSTIPDSQTLEYKTAWDAFGMSTVWNGEMPALQLTHAILQEGIVSAQAEQDYGMKEETYLATTSSTPEEVQESEAENSSDVLSTDQINPHPSFDEHADVNIFTTEDDSTSTQEIPSTSVQPDTPPSTQPSSEATPVPTAGMPDDSIFNAILNGEQKDSSPSSEPTPSSF